jgi:hypothetical protein
MTTLGLFIVLWIYTLVVCWVGYYIGTADGYDKREAELKQKHFEFEN